MTEITMSKPETEREVTVLARHVGVGEEWRSKEELARQEQTSRQYWKGIDDEKRAAILILMRDALLRLVEDPELWVPTSIEPKSGNRLDVFISINLAQVDGEVLRRRVETEKLISETCTDLVTLSSELDKK